jgi:hypothetical protein
MLSYYLERSCSPVHQDISDLELHVARRSKLYRTIGMPPIMFGGRRVLEIGPGGGFNSIVFLLWGADMDFVEPNPAGSSEIPGMMEKFRISPNRWRIYPVAIEEFTPERPYPIVIAEGFLPGMNERSGAVRNIRDSVEPGGVLSVTCADDVSMFFDILKRFVALRLLQSRGITGYEESISVLAEAYSSQLDRLGHASRSTRDWVMDVLLNPAMYGGAFGMHDCIAEMCDEFHFLGSSPSVFTDLSWYKDTGYREVPELLGQFMRRLHLLMDWKLPFSERPAEENETLWGLAAEFKESVCAAGDDPSEGDIRAACDILEKIRAACAEFSPGAARAVEEAVALVENPSLSVSDVSGSINFLEAMGRGQQYMGLIKKI